MTIPSHPQQDQPNTYFVSDRSNEDELNRLRKQDQIVTAGMGGVLPEQSDPGHFQRILDVACGTGGWLLQTAQTYPTIKLLIGIDISQRMIDYARTQAQTLQVDERVEFHVMDTLRMLELPSEYVNLVNMRMGASFLRTWDWRKLLQEFQRVTQPGGIIRIVESDVVGESTSSALNSLSQALVQAFHQAGHFFTPDHNGMINELPRLLTQDGLQNVQTQTYHIEYKAGTPEGQLFIEDMQHAFRTTVSFSKKWGVLSANYQELQAQALHDMAQPGFSATWKILTAWGHKPLT